MIDIEKLKQDIGAKLKEAREEKGISQEELAKMLGLSKVGYGALERGKNLIGLQYLIMLTHILDKPITFFLPASAVTDDERGNPLLDPLFQEFMGFWDRMSERERKFLIEWQTHMLEHRRSESGKSNE